jgi:uncharacterized membrane protein YeaQ/YmgE (transglycosylase-associated protein family)
MVIVQMDWFNWLMIGLLAGWLVSMVVKTQQGLFMNIGIGIAGALIGGFLFSLLGMSVVTGFNVWTWVVALIGAAVLLAAIHLFPRITKREI